MRMNATTRRETNMETRQVHWAVTFVAALAAGSGAYADNNWNSAGGNLQNTRSQNEERKITVQNAGGLVVKWVFNADGDVSATPAVDGSSVYFPDWAGKLYAVDRKTGRTIWVKSIADATGVPFDKARTTPALYGDKVIVGTQGSTLVPGGGPGGKVIAFDKSTGAVRWVTTLDTHPAAIVTQSAIVQDQKVFVGVASQEERLAGSVLDYPCCTFRGSMLALDVNTGAILWKTYMVPPGFSGNAVWGSSPAVDTKRKQVYVGTGNNYSVPAEVLQCVADNVGNPEAIRACSPTDNLFDSVVALDMATGAIRWVTRALPYDAWNASCPPFGDGSNCPDPAGPNYDFAQAPALFTLKTMGKTRQLLGIGQKSGDYWTLDPGTGAVVWRSSVGPGGTAGGLQWGSAVDGKRVYVADANSDGRLWTLPGGATTRRGVWSALDAATGQVLWQRTTPTNDMTNSWGDTSGPVTTANGVMFSCSVAASGYMFALSAASGEELWRFASGGSCLSGAAISNGEVYWGSGYDNFGIGTSSHKLYAFKLP
jgi:polyvinyl alcohol dehydrogenase (cytochrome)